MITIDYQSRFPIYEQIIENVEKYVALGILKKGDQIPSIRELASTLGINPNTVRKAYSILETKGVIETMSTKGTFITNQTDQITKKKIDDLLLQIKNLIQILEKLGLSKQEILKKLEKEN